MIERRSIPLCIVLTIVTFGIYGLIWFVWLTDDASKVSDEQQPTSGGIALLLTIVTCGIYGFYWAYKQGEKLDRASQLNGEAANSRGVLYIVLSVFGLSIVAYALMQDELNHFADLAAGAYGQPAQGYQGYQQGGYQQGGYQQQPYQQPYQQQPYQQPYQQQPYQQQPYQQQPYQQQPYQQQPYQQGDYQQPYQPQDDGSQPPEN